MKTKLELLGRTFLIYFTTILSGTIFSAIYLVAIDFERSIEFGGYFIFGVFITGVSSIPTILILFIGFFLIYKKCKNNTQKWTYITVIWLLTCYAPFFLAIAILVNPSSNSDANEEDFQLLVASIPYIFTSFISIFYYTYFFDKREPPIFEQKKKIMDDNILDAPF